MRLLLLAALTTSASCKKAVSVDPIAPQPVIALDTVLPTDPTIRTGVLPNGLTYFIEQNRLPENKAVLRLAVDAGSILEDDDQLGLAHFLEHMAFNGTESFPSNDLIQYLEGIGTEFGPHLNAHTGFEETVYKLTVPSDDPDVFDNGLKILKEWACCLTFDPDEIEAERGVVLEEWRSREGVGKRRRQAINEHSFFGSLYKDRLPIGTEQSLKTFDSKALLRFFEDWYRPDLMAVVVVGDVDVDAVERQIKSHFGPLTPHTDPRERPEFSVPEHAPRYGVFADAELTATKGWTVAKFDRVVPRTWGDVVASETQLVAITGLRERLGELESAPESPVLRFNAGANYRLTPHHSYDEISSTAKEGRALEAYRQMHTELKRFQTYGLTQGEFDRARKSRLSGLAKMRQEVSDRESVGHADEIVRHFLKQEQMLGTVPEADYRERAVNELTLEAVNLWAGTYLTSPTRYAMVTLPEKEGIPIPTPESLQQIENEVADADVTAPINIPSIDALIPSPTPGSITSTHDTYEEDLGFKGYTLSNGIKVYAKKTDFKTGEIGFQAFRHGGHATVPDADRAFATARMADRVRSESGLGGHDRSTVLRYLKGSSMRVNAGFGGYRTWITGRSVQSDLGIALEVAHAYQTDPAFSETGTEVTKEVWRDWLKNYYNEPSRQFDASWNEMVYPDDPRTPQLLMSDVEALTAEAARDIWVRSMGSPEEWTWTFIGDLPDTFEEQLEQWIASIPKAEPGYEWHDRGYRAAKGQHRNAIEAGTTKRARFRTEFYGTLEDQPDPTWVADFDGFGDVLSVRLREKLREDLGGVYGVSAWSYSWTEPEPSWRIQVEFQCDPDRVEELEAAMLEVFRDMQDNPVDASYVNSEISINREAYKDSLQSNYSWMDAFTDRISLGEDPSLFLSYLERNEQLTVEKVQKFAQDFLLSDNHATLIMRPETSP